MKEADEPTNLEQMLDRFKEAEHSDREVTLRDVVSEIGRRSFGPLLLLPGIITLLPIIGDIPGVPTVMAMLVLLVAVQLLFGRHYFWLPSWLLSRSVSQKKMNKALRWSRRPARFVDKFLKPRITALTHGVGSYAIAVTCVVIALAMPPMEVVPFTANGAGLALTLFGLSLMAHDGALAVIAFFFTLATLGFVFFNLL